jgi:hypothetical protein
MSGPVSFLLHGVEGVFMGDEYKLFDFNLPEELHSGFTSLSGWGVENILFFFGNGAANIIFLKEFDVKFLYSGNILNIFW